MTISQPSHTLHKAIFVWFSMILVHQMSHGQAFTGPSVVEPNSTHTYSYDDGIVHNPSEWLINGGQKVGASKSGTLFSVTIKWGSSGTGLVSFKSGMYLLGGTGVTIASASPLAPTVPTVANYQGFSRLTRGTPPSGEVWYWQGTPTGTSTSDSAPYIDRTTGTAYYLRAYKSSGNQWSPAATVNYTVGPIMAPAMPVKTSFPGYMRLTRETPPSFVIWYWQDAPTGTSTSNSSAYVDMTAGTAYYLRPYVAHINQWGPAVTVAYTVAPLSNILSNENYVHTIAPRTPTSDISTLSENDKMESVTYFDGLGRPMQHVGIRSGGNGEDIITHIGYDGFGRQDRDYLPYSSDTGHGLYRSDAPSATNTHYLATRYSADIDPASPNPYSEKEFDGSPLNRVMKQAAPGRDWKLGSGHEIGFGYGTNHGTEVRLYRVDLAYAERTYTPTLQLGTPTHYGQGELYKTVTRDENHDGTSAKAHTSEEFKDKQGRVVLKRTYGDSKVGGTIVPNAPHDTYYVYDAYGNLAYVLPPKMEASTAALATVKNQLNELGYQYKYDHRNRLVEKKVPGKGWEHIVYNRLDRPILTQDANLRAQNKWLFTKYDAFGRVAYTGEMTRAIGRIALQTEAEAAASQSVARQASPMTIDGTIIYYNNEAYPKTHITDILTINYYDNYTFDGFVHMPALYDGQVILNYNNASNTQRLTKGLATGSKVRVLDQAPAKWITTYTGYDVKGRPIYVRSVNDYLGTVDVVQSTLDFTGAVDKTVSVHTKNGMAIETKDVFLYDQMGRMVTHTQELNNMIEVIVENTYDDLGQLTGKGVGGKSTQGRLQNIDFTYNIRGWLKQINDLTAMGNNLFAFKINYNTNNHGGANLFNGNISETEWRTANDDSSLHWYRYSYDALNRLTDATDNFGKLKETLNYDKNGNITDLVRLGHIVGGTTIPDITIAHHFGTMDNLVYDYEANSNRLRKVSDIGIGNKTYGFRDGTNTGDDYAYDVSGNMIKDLNKGISAISYNYLNLPKMVTFGNGNISYIYDATGAKLSKKVVETGKPAKNIYYAGNYVYENSSLKYFGHPEGYVDAENGFGYVYQYKDHLGNIRLSYKDVSLSSTPSLEIQEENNYYPFGLRHKGYNNNIVSEHNWDYQGKENQQELGLDWHDFGARNYDAASGRWISIDPLSEEFHAWSSYNAMLNNPINFIDPDGQLALEVNEFREAPPTKFVNEKGEEIANTNDGNYQTFVIKEGNEKAFVNELKANVETKDDLKVEKNKELGEKHGYDIKNIEEHGNGAREYPTIGGPGMDFGFWSGYQTGFGSDKSQPAMDFQVGRETPGFSGGSTTGEKVGARHKAAGKMNIFDPQLTNTRASNSVEVNKAPKRGNSYKYSDKPIPLIIDN